MKPVGRPLGKSKIVLDKESHYLKELAKVTNSEIKHASDSSEISKGWNINKQLNILNVTSESTSYAGSIQTRRELSPIRQIVIK